MAKSGKMCVITNDFEEAKYRYENARSNWKDHWFFVCCEIFNNCKDWAKKYIIDTINKTIVTIKEVIKKTQPKTQKNSYTYLIKMFDDCGKWVYTKIGKTDNLKQRFGKLSKELYAREGVQIANIEPIKIYELPTDDLAQVLENFMRNYFRKSKVLIPNDRFSAFEPSIEDFEMFEKYFQLTIANA